MFASRPKNSGRNNGVALLVALWLLVILSLLCVNVTWALHSGFALAQRMKSDFELQQLVIAEFRDSLAKIPGSGFWSPSGAGGIDGKPNTSIRFVDESGRLNINAVNENNYRILAELVKQLGYSQEIANTIACSVVDWKDADQKVFQPVFGAEQDFYSSQKRDCKNLAVDSVEELLLVRGMTQDIFRKLKNVVTVFPKQGPLSVSLETASPEVVRSLTRAIAVSAPNLTRMDADGLTEKILSVRRERNSSNPAENSPPIDFRQLGLTSREQIIARSLEALRTSEPRFVRIEIVGTLNNGRSSKLEAVVRVDDQALVYWKRE